MRPLKTYCLIFIIIIVGGTFLPCSVDGQSSTATFKTLFEERNFEVAKRILLGKTKSNPDYTEAQYYLGRIAVEEKKYDLSVEKFEEAIAACSTGASGRANPRLVEYHNWLGVMYGVVAMNSNTLRQAYLAPKIKNEFEKAAALDPGNLQTQWGLINFYVKAPGFLGGSWDKALTSANVISRQDRAQGLRAFAFVHTAQNKTDLAEKELMAAIQQAPGDNIYIFALAKFYDDQKKYDKAFNLYEGVIKNYPDNMVAAFHLGHTSARSGLQFEKGIECLNNYLMYAPRPNEPAHCDANLCLAIIYEKKGDTVLARKYYETSLQLHPGLREAKEGLERVN